MEYNDTTFWSLLNKYGKRRLLLSVDFILALVLSLLFVYVANNLGLASTLFKSTEPIYAAVASGMIAIVIAALAIVVSMSDNDFITLLKKYEAYEDILFLFWYSAVLAGIAILLDVVGSISTTIVANPNIIIVYFFFSSFFTAYAAFAVVLSIGTVKRYGLYRAEIARVKKDKK